MRKIILASSSPRRIELLKKLGIKFDVIPSRIREAEIKIRDPIKFAKELAVRKAKSVARKVKNGIVIGADTVVVLDREIIGKPKNEEDAKQILKKLSGRTHKVITALAVIDAKTKRLVCDVEITKLKFRKMSEEKIKEYVKSGEGMDKAGAYAIQGKGISFLEKIEGSYSNVIGLPISKLVRLLKKFNIEVN
ncbi:MAG: Maf family protein [Candidatus Parvarchaeota archaeon]|nr:Maf family protein [Candidatus Jingweiarchaeum tengchongense]MCW1297707.1 Maf family protein [Candidatus Jingweiarchaeum tengchongense]MCW1299718.1 Maf family protein [Candidatus Jingweiarchaeum tengchongense]MCW1304314.1 Maf family protein [Candidatus Jingweiarchaeum tengchongense]MCW1305703.1 Maf family protein [Candidatus Jingweiarchaeum tengchongense]